jgi:transposase
MRKPLFVRALTPDERHALTVGFRSPNRVILRRCQILLASSRGQQARLIAEVLGCNDQTVRNVLHAFNTHGLAALPPGSSAPHHTPHAVFDAPRRERLRDLLHQTPRTFGKPSSLWTLPLAAEVAYAEGITSRQVSGEAIRLALRQLGVRWQRAKQWLTSPDPASARKKNSATD